MALEKKTGQKKRHAASKHYYALIAGANTMQIGPMLTRATLLRTDKSLAEDPSTAA
jgi:hypothetical protein